MKLFTLALLFVATTASAQWSNTTNLFYDSLHMAVCNAGQSQLYTLTVRSYPDSGYFVIWQDYRNDNTGYNDHSTIYAQKYDKAGNRLWAVNGVPVASGLFNSHYYYADDYRDHPYAATDNAGGFYIGFADDSVVSFTYQRACIQHMRSDGSAVWPGPGYILGSAPAAGTQVRTQLIGDGNGGAYVAFTLTNTVLHAYDYKDVGGTIQNLGGGIMNENGYQVTETGACGNYTTVTYNDPNVTDYNIYPDLQGGCNFIMRLDINGTQGKILAYNKLWRAKQDALATQYVLNLDFSALAQPTTYTKGNVYRLYYLITDHQEISCGSSANTYVENQYRLVQQGYQQIDGGASFYDFTFPKGVTISTPGNINASFLTGCLRSYSSSNSIADPVVKGYILKEEIFDSIPYQRTSSTNPDYPGYNQTEPLSLDKLGTFQDTLIAPVGGGSFDVALAGGGNQLFASSLITESNLSAGYRNLRLQHLAIESDGPNSYAVVYKTTTKTGVIIGQSGANSPSGNSYDLPVITVDNNGVALFCIIEGKGSSQSYIRVSPIFSGAQLAWGTMGRAIGTGYANNHYDGMGYEFPTLDPANGTALVAWGDTRNNGVSGLFDIYMRHLDNLTDPAYLPPYTRIRALDNGYGTQVSQNVLGSSGGFSTFVASATSNSADPGFTPVVDISDNYNLGNVTVHISENTTGTVRTTNGVAYLDRSYTITPDNNPNGAATVTVRLFFTTDQFNALKAADLDIKTPGDLAVIKQPGTGSGSTYSIVAGEKTVIPQAWAAVDGGYYIEIQVTSFSNFFIVKNSNPLPLTWLGIQAQWQNATQAKVSWQVADQQNVKTYTVQRSTDGIWFTDACSAPADSTETQYSCIAAGDPGKNYYRVVETDIDGKKNYSKVVTLDGSPSAVSLYPNPAKNALFVDGLAGYTLIQIADAGGRIIQRQTIVSAKQLINISTLTPGIYTLTLTGNSDSKTLRFIKY